MKKTCFCLFHSCYFIHWNNWNRDNLSQQGFHMFARFFLLFRKTVAVHMSFHKKKCLFFSYTTVLYFLPSKDSCIAVDCRWDLTFRCSFLNLLLSIILAGVLLIASLHPAIKAAYFQTFGIISNVIVVVIFNNALYF